MKPSLILSLLIVCFLLGCDTDDNAAISATKNNNLYFPPTDSADWATISATALGWDTDAAPDLKSFLQDKGTKAFIILKNGKLATEWYFDNHTQQLPWYWASAGKTLTAFMVGKAQEEGFLNITDQTAAYLGQGWTSLPANKEQLITIEHQLNMTSGLNPVQFDCLSPECLTYLADAGERWAYHNGPYTLLHNVVTNATKMDFSDFFNSRLRDKIGMTGFWKITQDQNKVYFSNARSMARFGLLNLNNGVWDGATILEDSLYMSAMTNSSQNHNPSYGYLWWLNGKSGHMLPKSLTLFDGPLIPNAPADTYAGLGKNDQKLYIVPSQGLVIVRMGEDFGEEQLTSSSFDTLLWEALNKYIK